VTPSSCLSKYANIQQPAVPARQAGPARENITQLGVNDEEGHLAALVVLANACPLALLLHADADADDCCPALAHPAGVLRRAETAAANLYDATCANPTRLAKHLDSMVTDASLRLKQVQVVLVEGLSLPEQLLPILQFVVCAVLVVAVVAVHNGVDAVQPKEHQADEM
jgi:hypothetical protein